MISLYSRRNYSETKLFIHQYIIIYKVLVQSNIYPFLKNHLKEGK